jgi:hypothetical protein
LTKRGENSQIKERKNLNKISFFYSFSDMTQNLHETVGCRELGIRDRAFSTNPMVCGAIGRPKCFRFWRDVLKAPQDILDVVSKGYKLPFKEGLAPPSSHLGNNKSSLANREFVDEQLYMYERIGAIKATKHKPHIILPMSAVFSNKMRLVIDGSRNLNPYLEDQKVKLSHLDVANESLEAGQWFATLDLESGYHQVPMHKDHHQYLGVEWTRRGKTVYFV